MIYHSNYFDSKKLSVFLYQQEAVVKQNYLKSNQLNDFLKMYSYNAIIPRISHALFAFIFFIVFFKIPGKYLEKWECASNVA